MASEQLNIIEQISSYLKIVNEAITEMIAVRKEANLLDIKDRAKSYNELVIPYFNKIRYASDKLELLVEDKLWPLAKNRELLNLR